MSPLIWCTISRFIRHWQDLQLQHGRQAEYTAPQLPIVHKAAENLCASQMGQDIKAVYAEYLFMQQRLCWCVPEWLWITPTTYGRDSAYCLKSRGGVRGIYASLWRFLLRCALFCRSAATFLTSVPSYEGGCGFEDHLNIDIVYFFSELVYFFIAKF